MFQPERKHVAHRIPHILGIPQAALPGDCTTILCKILCAYAHGLCLVSTPDAGLALQTSHQTIAPMPTTAAHTMTSANSGALSDIRSKSVSSSVLLRRGFASWVHHQASWNFAPENPRDRNFPTGTKLSLVNSRLLPRSYGRRKQQPNSPTSPRQTSAQRNAGCAGRASLPYRSSSPSSTKCFESKQN